MPSQKTVRKTSFPPLRPKTSETPCRDFVSHHFQLVPLTDGVYAALATPGGMAVSNAGIIDLGDMALIFDTFLSERAAGDLFRSAAAVCRNKVLWIVVSNPRQDHHWGLHAFPPGIRILGTEATREAILAQNGSGDLENHYNRLESLIEGGDTRLEDIPEMRTRGEVLIVKGFGQALRESHIHRHSIVPNLTFWNTLSLFGNKRRAEILSFGRGTTPGDAFLYLPDDHIIFTGDLVCVGMHPDMSEAYADEWIQTLVRMKTLNVKHLVPGRGGMGTAKDISWMSLYLENVVKTSEKLAGNDSKEIEPDLPEPFRRWLFPGMYKTNIRALIRKIQDKTI
jgi:cyclase